MPSASEYLNRKFVQSLINLRYPVNTDIQFISVYGSQIPFARNSIVDDAIKNESDYLLFIDVDMVFPSDLFLRLYEHKKDIVNALAFRRIDPHYPCIFEWKEKTKCYETKKYTKGLLSVDATGMAACLINLDVFKKLKKPYYYYRDNIFSSDLTFCWNLKKAGYEIFVDTDLKIGHIGSERVIDESYYLNHLSPEAKKEHNENIKQIIKENE